MGYQLYLYTHLSRSAAIAAGTSVAGTTPIPMDDARIAAIRDAGLSMYAKAYIDGSERPAARSALEVTAPGWEAALQALQVLAAKEAAFDAELQDRSAAWCQAILDEPPADVSIEVDVGLYADGRVTTHSYDMDRCVVRRRITVTVPGEVPAPPRIAIGNRDVTVHTDDRVREARDATWRRREERRDAAVQELLPALREELRRELDARAVVAAREAEEYRAIYARLDPVTQRRDAAGFATASEITDAVRRIIVADAGYQPVSGCMRGCKHTGHLTDAQYAQFELAQSTAPRGAGVEVDAVRAEIDGQFMKCARVQWSRGGITATAWLHLGWGDDEEEATGVSPIETAEEYAARRSSASAAPEQRVEPDDRIIITLTVTGSQASAYEAVRRVLDAGTLQDAVADSWDTDELPFSITDAEVKLADVARLARGR